MCRHTLSLSGYWWRAFPSPARYKVLGCHQIKFWDVTKYCSIVPALVPSWSSCTCAGTCSTFVDPFPTDKIKSISHTCPEEFLPWWKPYQEAMLHIWKLLQAQAEYRTDYLSITLSLTCSHPWGLQPRKKPFSSCPGALESCSEISEADLGLHFLPAGAGWVAESH